MARRFPAALSLTALALAACGGGGGGATPASINVPTPVPIVKPSSTATATTCTAFLRASAGKRLAASAGSDVDSSALYVTFRPDARRLRTGAHDLSVDREGDLGSDGGVVHRAYHLAPGTDAAQIAGQLRAEPGVVSVDAVHRRFIASDAVANDQYLDTTNQWYLYRTNTDPAAWNLTHGSSAVKIAILDTGVDETNQDLNPKIDFKESVINGKVTTGAGSVQDADGHGTNVAGLAAAATNNTYGFASVGYDTHLLAFKIFADVTAANPCPSASTADEALAIRDAVAQGASVISLSLGSPQSGAADTAEQNAVAYAIANNVTVVAAAGNEYPKSGSNVPDFPGGYPGVIAVGASAVADATPNSYGSIVTEKDASYSNSGPTLLAPGGDASGTSDTDILHWIEGYSTTTAALPDARCTNSGGVCRALFNGTSQATPQVSGAVALMMALHGGPRSLTPAAVTSILTRTADTLPGVASARQGAGRLNVANAVAAAR